MATSNPGRCTPSQVSSSRPLRSSCLHLPQHDKRAFLHPTWSVRSAARLLQERISQRAILVTSFLGYVQLPRDTRMILALDHRLKLDGSGIFNCDLYTCRGFQLRQHYGNCSLYPLMVLFLYGTTTPEISFLLIGVGVRLAQDVGAHRKRVKTLKEWTTEDELWKRIFWALVITDVIVSAFVGRPRATTSEQCVHPLGPLHTFTNEASLQLRRGTSLGSR